MNKYKFSKLLNTISHNIHNPSKIIGYNYLFNTSSFNGSVSS